MDEVLRLVVRLVGDSASYQHMLRQAQHQANRAAAAIRRAARQMEAIKGSMLAAGRALQQGGRWLTTRVTLPLAAAGGAAVKMGADFEASMQKIVGLVGVSQRQVDQWKKDLVAMAPALGRSPQELANALFFITSAGLRGSRAIDALTASAKASVGGLGETMVVADAVTSAMNAYAKVGMTAARATDILVATVREGKLEADSLAGVIGRLLPMAAALNVDFEDVAGTMAVMSRTGMDAAEAAVSVQAILMTLQKPSAAARRILSQVGLSFQELRNIAAQPGGLLDVIRLLDERFGDNEEALAQIVPNVRALRGVMNVLAQDADTVRSVMEGVRNSANSTQRAFEALHGTVAFAASQVWSRLKSILVTIGQRIGPVMVRVMDRLRSVTNRVIDWWDRLSPQGQELVLVLAGLTAAAGPVLVLLGSLASVVGTVVVPAVIALTSGLASLVSFLTSVPGLIAAAIGGTAAVVGAKLGLLDAALEQFRQGWETLVREFRTTWRGIALAIQAGDLRAAMRLVLLSAQVLLIKFLGWVRSGLARLQASAARSWTNLVAGLKTALEDVRYWVVSQFAKAFDALRRAAIRAFIQVVQALRQVPIIGDSITNDTIKQLQRLLNSQSAFSKSLQDQHRKNLDAIASQQQKDLAQIEQSLQTQLDAIGEGVEDLVRERNKLITRLWSDLVRQHRRREAEDFLRWLFKGAMTAWERLKDYFRARPIVPPVQETRIQPIILPPKEIEALGAGSAKLLSALLAQQAYVYRAPVAPKQPIEVAAPMPTSQAVAAGLGQGVGRGLAAISNAFARGVDRLANILGEIDQKLGTR